MPCGPASLPHSPLYFAIFQVSDSFPYEWIKKKWREGFYVTCMATATNQWAIIMSRTSGISEQVSSG